jgi:ATP-dependent DNA helicase DinG
MDENQAVGGNVTFDPIEFFPMEEAREKQVKALDFVKRAVEQGYTDIVIQAPTGIGKTGIGAAIALWAETLPAPVPPPVGPDDPQPEVKRGAYYLVTQKLLQDQLDDDIKKFKPKFRKGCSLKSAVAYHCDQHDNCLIGSRQSKANRCRKAANGECPYRQTKAMFNFQPLAITNYPYFFTERSYVGEMPMRTAVIADECHTLEKQVLGFVELTITAQQIEEYAPYLELPDLPTLEDFAGWMRGNIAKILGDRIEVLRIEVDQNSENRSAQDELYELETYYGRMTTALDSIAANPENWVYWGEVDQEAGQKYIAKPISAIPFMKTLLFDAAPLRIYMSAYPGPKGIFCRSLGLDPQNVAWISLSSTFPPQNRLVHMMFVGSMGKKSQEITMPSVLRMCERILNSHKNDKGLIHTHSYKLGEAIYKYLAPRFEGRILYPRTADERNVAFMKHRDTVEPTVILSPSMTEGFNLQDDLARFQIIPKIPYPYLGDKQVEAKRDADPEWYAMQTAMTIIQACGRIVRSDDDHGETYILDADFKMLYDRHQDFFPKWFREGFKWYDKK